MANRLDVFVHLVWSTKGRLPLVTRPVTARLYAHLAERCRGLGCTPLAIGGMPDHVHVLVSLHATVSVAALAKDVKGASSHFMRTVLTPDVAFRWQEGYAAFSVSKRGLPALQDYIAHQESHHSRGDVVMGAEPIPER